MTSACLSEQKTSSRYDVRNTYSGAADGLAICERPEAEER